MHDFDKERRERHEARVALLGDRTFKFCGQEFAYVANAPYRITQAVAAISENSEGSAVFDTLEMAVTNLIETEYREAFSKACDPASADPVTFDDLISLANWLIEKQADRPPTPPESSAGGPRKTGTASTVTSSDEPAVA